MSSEKRSVIRALPEICAALGHAAACLREAAEDLGDELSADEQRAFARAVDAIERAASVVDDLEDTMKLPRRQLLN